MSAQQMLGFKQGDQGNQSGLMNKVLFSRSVLLKSSPPILLPLATPSRKPTSQGDLPEEAQKNRKPDHLKPPIINLRSQGMDCSTVRTPIPLEQKRFIEAIKKTPHITMTPQSRTPAPRTPRRTRPRIVLVPIAQFLQQLDIEIAIQYQVRSLWGITENTTPARECILGYPFSFPSTYSEKKKDLYNKR
jgi:hypothetical protein